jgi:hypothetical protein
MRFAVFFFDDTVDSMEDNLVDVVVVEATSKEDAINNNGEYDRWLYRTATSRVRNDTPLGSHFGYIDQEYFIVEEEETAS